MVVCRFFQQGYCRYGQNCRFEHVYGSKYSYQANPQPQAAPPPQPSGVTDEQLINQVQADVQAVLRGGQWVLSCYSPFKEKAIFPGIPDLSAEEARLFIYEAKANNNVDQAMLYMNNMFKESRQKYEQLLQPNATIFKVLKSLYKGETTSSPFSSSSQNAFNNTTTNNTASSIFRSAVQNGQTSTFNQNTSNQAQTIFNQVQNSIFNSQASDSAKELFSKANTSIFNTNQSSQIPIQSTNPFAQDTAKSIFASAAQNSFNNQINPSNIFAAANQSVFNKEPSQNMLPFSQNMFQGSISQTSMSNQANSQINDVSGVYSRMEDLIEEDIEAYKSESFQLGFVPEMPPPQMLCDSIQVRGPF